MQEHKCARLPPVARGTATLVLAWVGAFGLWRLSRFGLSLAKTPLRGDAGVYIG